jgi:putative flippase GtrA
MLPDNNVGGDIPAMSEPTEQQEPIPHRRSLPLYVGAGLISTAGHYAVTIAAVELTDVVPIFASSIGFMVGAGLKYWLNYAFAFDSQRLHRRAIPRFALALFAMFLLNGLLFGVLHDVVGLHYLLAQVLTTVLLIIPGYVINRRWVFGVAGKSRLRQKLESAA